MTDSAEREHDIRFRRDWMGDPDVPHGTQSWLTPYCVKCGAEGEEELEHECRGFQ